MGKNFWNRCYVFALLEQRMVSTSRRTTFSIFSNLSHNPTYIRLHCRFRSSDESSIRKQTSNLMIYPHFGVSRYSKLKLELEKQIMWTRDSIYIRFRLLPVQYFSCKWIRLQQAVTCCGDRTPLCSCGQGQSERAGSNRTRPALLC